MEEKILITYASRCGSTAEIAQAMAKMLPGCGELVDVCPVSQVRDLGGYKTVIIGSAVRKSQWLPEAVTFVKENRLTLRRIPTGFFTVCLRMADPNEINRRAALRFLDPVYPYHHADLEGYFGGCLDYGRLSLIERTVMKARGGFREGDYRDWKAIQAWTDEAFRRLVV